VYLDPADARELGVGHGDTVCLRSETGEMPARVHLARLPRHTVQVHWPEANGLLPGGAEHREPGSSIPDYQAVVEIVKA
jgi:anaerobic selenocysteine-containing dehydrogenase